MELGRGCEHSISVFLDYSLYSNAIRNLDTCMFTGKLHVYGWWCQSRTLSAKQWVNCSILNWLGVLEICAGWTADKNAFAVLGTRVSCEVSLFILISDIVNFNINIKIHYI